jgi:hypothetical protein
VLTENQKLLAVFLLCEVWCKAAAALTESAPLRAALSELNAKGT